jgi:anti-sigma factor RsiW
MKGHCSIEELSAYVDGESKQPGRVAEHLARCPECTQRRRELVALSTRLRSLPEPDVNPAFVTRVLARASETSQEPKVRWLWTWPRIALAGGMAAIVAFGAFFAVQSGRGASSDAYLGARLASDSSESAAPSGDEVSADDLIAGLSDTEWFVTLASAWEDDDELDAVIQSLNADETVVFERLLHEYAEESRTI